jgi:hypothetical protein
MKNQIASEIFHYTTSRWDWQDGNVNQMWIEEVSNYDDTFKYVAVAHNPRNNTSMVMSNPRSHYDTLLWVRKFCGSFSILPV